MASDIQEPHKELVDLLENHKNVFYEKGDLTDQEFVAAIFRKYVEKLGYIDILINAAGIMNELNVDLTIKVNVVREIGLVITKG